MFGKSEQKLHDIVETSSRDILVFFQNIFLRQQNKRRRRFATKIIISCLFTFAQLDILNLHFEKYMSSKFFLVSSDKPSRTSFQRPVFKPIFGDKVVNFINNLLKSSLIFKNILWIKPCVAENLNWENRLWKLRICEKLLFLFKYNNLFFDNPTRAELESIVLSSCLVAEFSAFFKLRDHWNNTWHQDYLQLDQWNVLRHFQINIWSSIQFHDPNWCLTIEVCGPNARSIEAGVSGLSSSTTSATCTPSKSWRRSGSASTSPDPFWTIQG